MRANLRFRMLAIHNAHIISPGVDLESGSIATNDGSVTAIHDQPAAADSAGEIFDAKGCLVVPGFIDIHTHGAGGASIMEGTEEAVRKMADFKLREGVTSFLPTTWTAPESDLIPAMNGVAAYQANQDRAKTPAVHIEGPFINIGAVGAQDPAFVRPPDIAEVDRLNALAPIKLLSVASETDGGVEFVRELVSRGITASLAHTKATWEQFLEAKAAGLTHLTHFCNQMTGLHHRGIGIVGAALLDDDIRLEMICDTIHLCPEMIALTFKHIPVERIMIITDSISASWLPDGDYIEAGHAVRVVDGVCRLQSNPDALAGSTSRFFEGIANVWRITKRPLSELIRTTSWNQAQSLGLADLGKIEPGFRADFAVLDPETLEPRATIVEGEVRFQA
ncbi:MAG: N-acetylglucosamine-6-phosphate deacetylase [Verrucomicrobiales bacterium]|jgi:N-acetylglucosamine-6-phosphate deacetylase